MSERLPHFQLSRRESQVMDAVYRLGEASVSDVLERMPDDPGYNAVRNTLAILERKGHLRHRREGKRYVYSPVEGREAARRSAAQHLLQTFFDGSLSDAVLALLGAPEESLTKEDLDEIAEYIEEARQEAE